MRFNYGCCCCGILFVGCVASSELLAPLLKGTSRFGTNGATKSNVEQLGSLQELWSRALLSIGLAQSERASLGGFRAPRASSCDSGGPGRARTLDWSWTGEQRTRTKEVKVALWARVNLWLLRARYELDYRLLASTSKTFATWQRQTKRGSQRRRRRRRQASSPVKGIPSSATGEP